jgi:hypothetical protein
VAKRAKGELRRGVLVAIVMQSLPESPSHFCDPVYLAHRVFEWVKLVFPDVNVLVLVNVNVPEKVWSHSLKAKFRKHCTNPSKQKLSGAIFVRGDVAKSVE